MRITFVIGSLVAGGAQRVLVLLSEGLIREGHLVSIVTLNGREKDFYDLPKGVERLALNISTRVQTFFRFLQLRWGILSTKPEVVVSFIDTMNIMTLVAMWRTKVPIVVSERSDPASTHIGPFWECLRWWTYAFAERIVVQTTAVAEYFLPRFQSKVCIIPNPVIPPRVSKQGPTTLPKPLLIAVGSLYANKGFDLLLHAFSQQRIRHPEWTLIILGEGPFRSRIQALQKSLQLNDSVRLMGRVHNPYDYLVRADLFVLPSHFEGFPNALCEAMACGLAVISTDYYGGGPGEILKDGQDGVIVPNQNIKALSDAMGRLMSDGNERRRLGQNASRIVERFNLNKVVKRWGETIWPTVSTRQIVIK